jgi:AAA+ ATPase superfamily predicted ATPase
VATRRTTGNLPIAVTSFVGRRREIDEVRRRLSEARLVTLTGPGGVGKPRLAIEVAERSRRAFAGRVWMVDLSSVEDGARVPQAVVSSMGLGDRSTSAPLDKLLDYLGDEDGLVPVVLQRYIASKLSWVNYHELSETGHFLSPVPGLGDTVLRTLFSHS